MFRLLLVAASALALTGCARLGHGVSGSVRLTYSASAARSSDLASITWDLPEGEPTTVDPVKAGDYGPDMLASNLCDDLFRMDAHWGWHPELARAYHYGDGHRTLVLDIRRGVRFWDGHPLTASDVVYSLKRNMDANTGAVNGGFFTTVAAIDQTGAYQVTIHFKSPDELFIKELATVVGAVVEKAYVERVGNKAFGSAKGGLMCSGPYELHSWTPGTQMVLTRNPHYWDPSIHADVQSVTVKFISDTSTLTSALASGEIDGAYEVPPVAIPALEGTSSGHLHFGPSLEIQLLVPSSTTGLGTNPAVRRALSLSLDRAAIADRIYDGAASPDLALTPPSAWSPAAARQVYARGYRKLGTTRPDLALAKKLVAKVPHHSRPLVLAIQGGDQTQVDLATLVQQYAAQLGLNVRIKQEQPLDFSNLFYIPSYRKGLDFVLTTGFLDIPDQLDYLAYWIYPHAIFNWTGYRDPRTVALVNRALGTFAPVKRAQLLVDAQTRYMHAGVIVPMFSLDEVSYLSDRLAGATTSFAYIFQPSFAYLGPA